ncbi:hypothetical protein HJC23_001654 [Cyclotella cryptica]|uniref:Uncharacterized protein n=1 Tax=Cyclotella cryptica TaxID=29204 RepID=A0ABD3QK79_9STRA|eukprot:CCRYP_004685-RA/>CCRYP_004685-RA protein AED:0.19 eAED:0.19 QI:10/-1/1/1/-1/1/1/155/1093
MTHRETDVCWFVLSVPKPTSSHDTATTPTERSYNSYNQATTCRHDAHLLKMNDSTLLLHDDKPSRPRRSSSDDQNDGFVNSQRRTMTASTSSCGRSLLGTGKRQPLPSIRSPLATHYLLTLTTAVLATVGFVLSLFAALSCDFLRVNLNDDGASSPSSAVNQFDGSTEETTTGTSGWYYNELLERQPDHTLSVGIFCPTSLMTQGGHSNSKVALSKAFLTTSLIMGAFLLSVTCAISTILPNHKRLWNIISFTAGLSFLCQLPVFFIIDSPPCNQVDFTCSLSGGSFGLFCSMVCYLILALLTQWNEAPDWKEEYELWRLIHTAQVDRVVALHDNDEELGIPCNTVKPCGMEHDTTKVAFSKQANHQNQSNVVPQPPIDVSPGVVKQREKRLARQTRMSETSNFVGKYINVETDPSTPSRGTSQANAISPITHVSMDESSAVETEEYEFSSKSEEITKEAQINYSDLINRELKKSIDLQKGIKERQLERQPEQQNLNVSEEVSHLSFPALLDFNDTDVNVKAFQETNFEATGSFDRVFHEDRQKGVRNDVNDEPKPPKAVAVEHARAVDDISVCKSERSVSTRPMRGLSAKQVNQSMKSIFRKIPGKEQHNKNRTTHDDKVEIEEKWMLEETSLGRSNSDELLFLVERHQTDCGSSVHSKKSKVTVLSWSSRCKSPEQRKGVKPGHTGAEASNATIVSPTPPQIHRATNSVVVSPCNEDREQFYDKMLPIPSPIISVEKLDSRGSINGSAIVSPEKDDPGVEMYPSDASLSTLSLPTGSDHYYTSESEDDRRSRSTRETGFQVMDGASNGTDSETESEMSLIIAGVQRINRKTCGKPTPLNKRRRRRKRSSRSGSISIGSEYSSHSGSLLDEVIDEEDELNESGEPVPSVIQASPMKCPTKKSKSPGMKSRSPKKKSKRNQDSASSDAEHSGYESGYAHHSDLSDNDSKKVGYRQLSETEESTSSRAARTRRNRLLSKRQIHIDPDSMPDGSDTVSDASGYKSPSHSHYSGNSSRESSVVQSQRKQMACDSVPLLSKTKLTEDGFVSSSQRGHISWQARNSRMSRLRLQRQSSDPIVRGHVEILACASEEGSI